MLHLPTVQTNTWEVMTCLHGAGGDGVAGGLHGRCGAVHGDNVPPDRGLRQPVTHDAGDNQFHAAPASSCHSRAMA